MARWTVQDGDQVMVIQGVGGRVIIDLDLRTSFNGSVAAIRDMRRKLGLAIGEVEPAQGVSDVDV